jgi:hypothetical protein
MDLQTFTDLPSPETQAKPVSHLEIRCNRTACNNHAHPCGWNQFMMAMYCRSCAVDIRRRGSNNIFPYLNRLRTVSWAGIPRRIVLADHWRLNDNLQEDALKCPTCSSAAHPSAWCIKTHQMHCIACAKKRSDDFPFLEDQQNVEWWIMVKDHKAQHQAG